MGLGADWRAGEGEAAGAGVWMGVAGWCRSGSGAPGGVNGLWVGLPFTLRFALGSDLPCLETHTGQDLAKQRSNHSSTNPQ